MATLLIRQHKYYDWIRSQSKDSSCEIEQE